MLQRRSYATASEELNALVKHHFAKSRALAVTQKKALAEVQHENAELIAYVEELQRALDAERAMRNDLAMRVDRDHRVAADRLMRREEELKLWERELHEQDSILRAEKAQLNESFSELEAQKKALDDQMRETTRLQESIQASYHTLNTRAAAAAAEYEDAAKELSEKMSFAEALADANLTKQALCSLFSDTLTLEREEMEARNDLISQRTNEFCEHMNNCASTALNILSSQQAVACANERQRSSQWDAFCVQEKERAARMRREEDKLQDELARLAESRETFLMECRSILRKMETVLLTDDSPEEVQAEIERVLASLDSL